MNGEGEGGARRFGRPSGWAGEGAWTRFVALLCATAVLVLTGGAFVATTAAYSGRESRSDARNPAIAAEGDHPTALWTSHWDSYRGRQFAVVLISPLTDDAPLPPGVAHWPAPGEVLLSPALRDGPPEEDFAHRYGSVAGTVGPQGLASPGERLAYVRPTAELASTTKRWVGITGYGGGSKAAFGDIRIVRPAGELLAALAVLLALPALVLAVVAARTGAVPQDRRLALLTVLGARRRDRARAVLAAAVRPVAAGVVTGAALLLPFLVLDVELPWIDYRLDAGDLRRAWPWLGAATVLALALIGAVLLLVRPRSATGAGRPTRSAGAGAGAGSRAAGPGSGVAGRLRTPVLGMCGGFLLLAWFAGPLFGGGRSSAQVFIVATTGLLVTLPAAVSWAVSRTVGPLAAAAARRSRGPALIAARTAAAHPGLVAGLTSALVLCAGLLGQARLLTDYTTMTSGGPARVAAAGQGAAAIVQASAAARPDQRFLAALPPGVHTVSVGSGPAGLPLVQAPCAELTALALPCPTENTSVTVPAGGLDRRLREAVLDDGGSAGPTGVAVRTGALTGLRDDGSYGLVVVADGGRLDVPAVKAAVYRHLGATANVDVPGERGQSAANAHQARWVTFLGGAGALVLLLAIGFGALAQALRFAAAVAPLAPLGGDGRLVRSAARHLLGLPVLTAVVLATALDTVLALPRLQTPDMLATPARSLTDYGALLAAALLLTATLTATAGTAATRLAGRWTPAGD
ncbi:hypothetical protein ATKI12_4942 [Kitasatospora sp. Ki12]|uniref:hypothetical protein n=1 Tax=Kitasatospora xanthocidica TaxID=83382 RepID=UPI00167706AD|nr:hypothetical protein [Kitasatospora xanthocidica]GHF66442.1 hypothetical protein GCM10018790_50510 [Kitasatospora xanthocidica]